jgi:ferritin
MLSDSIQQALNKQIQHEFNSAHAYLAMSAYFEATNFSGFAKWTRMQFQEEMEHGMRLFDFVHARGGRVTLHAIAEPTADFKSTLDVFKQALEQERSVTKLIHDLYELAMNEKDYATQVELQWFITEQIEEEKTFEEILLQLDLAGDDRAALFMLDRQMAARQATDV